MTLPAFLRQAPPSVAVDIAPDRVAVTRIERRGSGLSIAAFAVEPLPPGAVSGALATPNMPDVGAVATVVRRALETAGARTRRVSLVVPDSIARVSLVRFDALPAKRGDLDELIRWQVKKTTPFPLDDATVAYTGAMSTPGAHEFLVTVARKDVLAQYERACDLAGTHAGIVDVSTCNVVNAVLASGEATTGDCLLVHAAPTYVSLAVLRDGRPIFYRTRGDDADGSVADLVHQTAMYYEDRLAGRQFAKVLLAGGSTVAGADVLRRELSDRLGLDVVAVNPFVVVTATTGVSAPLADALAPGVGLLLRDMAGA
jgi:type IV pilus assembly protein PilM